MKKQNAMQLFTFMAQKMDFNKQRLMMLLNM